jgi:hypothetical protein
VNKGMDEDEKDKDNVSEENDKDSDIVDADKPDEVEKASSIAESESLDALAADDGKSTTSSAYAPSNADVTSMVSEVALNEDPKFVWTAEEDLRLIDAIKTLTIS